MSLIYVKILYMKSREDHHLGYFLNRVAVALRTEVTTTVLEPLGLTFAQYVCLRILAQSAGLSNAELARAAGVSSQAMNTVVQGLQMRSLVTRPASVSSGRSRPAELTRAGVQLLKRTDPGIAKAERHLLAKLNEQDRIDFRRILAALDDDPIVSQ
jgi:DNA-binding MarR family transcriptional regulator